MSSVHWSQCQGNLSKYENMTENKVIHDDPSKYGDHDDFANHEHDDSTKHDDFANHDDSANHNDYIFQNYRL